MGRNLMIHTFATDNYAGWTELLLHSVRKHFGPETHVLVDSWNFSTSVQEKLRSIHSNTVLRNNVEDPRELAEKLGVDLATLVRWRDEIANVRTTKENFLYKIHFSVDKRYRSMESVADYAKAHGYEFLIHTDTDIYFRSPLTSLTEIMSTHDVCLYLRNCMSDPEKNPLGAFLAFSLNERTDAFLANWMAEIDSVPFADRWKGFGQCAIKSALENSPSLNVGDLSTLPNSPRYSKDFDQGSDLWLTSNNKLYRGAEMKTAREICWKDLQACDSSVSQSPDR